MRTASPRVDFGLHLRRELNRQWHEDQIAFSDLDPSLVTRDNQVLPGQPWRSVRSAMTLRTARPIGTGEGWDLTDSGIPIPDWAAPDDLKPGPIIENPQRQPIGIDLAGHRVWGRGYQGRRCGVVMWGSPLAGQLRRGP